MTGFGVLIVSSFLSLLFCVNYQSTFLSLNFEACKEISCCVYWENAGNNRKNYYVSGISRGEVISKFGLIVLNSH